MQKEDLSRPRRILAAWFPRWPTDHSKKQRPSLEEASAPIVIHEKAKSALRIRAMDVRAAKLGFYQGQALADARAIEPKLIAVDANAEEETQSFRRLAEALMRYSPVVSVQATGEIFIDITGCQRLFGGEEAILRDLRQRIARAGYSMRVAIADTPGAAWAIARFGNLEIAGGGAHRVAIASLPVEALRLPPDLSDRLRRLGLKNVGQLYNMPRSPLTARFTKVLLSRLGQALGTEAEPLVPIIPAPRYYSERKLAEPVSTIDAVKSILAPLANDLAEDLARDSAGARRFELALFRVDNAVTRMSIGASAPARDAKHIARLFENRLDDLKDDYDAGFGFELLRLSAFDVRPLGVRQRAAFDLQSDREAQDEALAELKDRLSNRLGATNVRRISFRDTHLPERAAHFTPVFNTAMQTDVGPVNRVRPVKLLPRPEEIEALAEVPDGPPIRFKWRRVAYAVARANGPERIADEWQGKEMAGLTRDYYRVETAEGRRYWLFREGLYGAETTNPRWFLHGFFA
ncbi:Y-family DNA polymerase [Hyphococcus sp.]|uniref:Y-family DNA polymerase n=1 Tax=Hyphococcus sp. TaxID=2038636 RepID=UPI003CCBCD50